MPHMHHGYDLLAYLKEVRTDLYKEDVEVSPTSSTSYDVHMEEEFAPPSPLQSHRSTPILCSQATLPVHLISYILRFLDPPDDADTLLACMQTCRLWYLPAQMRLYKSIVVKDERSLFLLWDKLCTLPHLRRRVKEIRVRDSKTAWFRNSPFHSSWDNPLWLFSTPSRLAPLVPSVKLLSFEQIDWHKLRLREDPPSLRWLSQWTTFSSLQQVKLSSCAFSCFREFEMVMMSLPVLDHLNLDAVTWGDRSAATADALRADSRRERLAFEALTIGRQCDMNSIVMWILATSTLGRIKRLEILAGHESDPEVVVPFITRFCDTLEYLTVGCNGMAQSLSSVVVVYTDFHNWPRLHTLHLVLGSMAVENVGWTLISLSRAMPTLPSSHTHCPFKQCSPQLPCTICSSSVSVTSIRRVVFELFLASPRELDNPLWDQIVWIMTNLVANGRGVRKIVFIQRGSMPYVQADYVIKMRMGSFLSQILEVVTEWDER
ncbi:hypothetical protein EIP91_003551 [Steccherinum ochraceum]|uniref:F-box domain-containing protein n=1 Tax=Steccherinum ochraceum TaxID=92696 RepID=A0A4V2MW46_9APHY|nr:hypothetical protein EIP91_003551 [Steccherinum ochraceum]